MDTVGDQQHDNMTATNNNTERKGKIAKKEIVQKTEGKIRRKDDKNCHPKKLIPKFDVKESEKK